MRSTPTGSNISRAPGTLGSPLSPSGSEEGGLLRNPPSSRPVRILSFPVVDFGDSRTLVSVVIEWELPAMAFNVQLSSDGTSWKDAFATDVNGLFTNRIYLGYASASKLRLVRK